MSYVFWRPSTYVSTATLYVPMTFSLPGGNLMTEDPVTFWGTQTELLKCPRLRALTLESLSNRTTQALPLGRDGQPLPVHISLTHRPKSPVFLVSATGSLPAYTERYLDALLVQFFNYKQNVRREVSGATLASISGQVQKAERDLKSDQDAFQTFERTNRLAVLQSCATGAVDNLMKLSIQSSDLQLEERLVRHSAPAEAASLEAIRLKIEQVRHSQQEWQRRIAETSRLLAEGERLQQRVERSRSGFDRLLTLCQSVDIARNASQEPLCIMQNASPAQLTSARQVRLLALAGGGGLGVGLGIIGLIALNRASRRPQPPPDPRPDGKALNPTPAERLAQLNGLQAKGLLSQAAYDRKVEQILASL